MASLLCSLSPHAQHVLQCCGGGLLIPADMVHSQRVIHAPKPFQVLSVGQDALRRCMLGTYG